MKPLFAIGNKVVFGPEAWIVERYHKINHKYEIMMRNEKTGLHRSISIAQLEPFVKGGK